MKQLKKLTALFTILLAMVVIAPACSDDDDNNNGGGAGKNALVGTWVGYDSDGDMVTLVFKADGTGIEEYEYDSDVEDFTWTATESTITFIYASEPGKPNTVGYSLSGNKLTIEGITFTKR